METRLILPENVLTFMAVFQKHRHLIYVVGGAVRDLLLGKTVTNWDFTTDATPEEILQLFPAGIYNNQYGTVTIPPLLFEITPFRKEADYTDFRHPQSIVWAKTIEEDLARRDFTINAMAYDGKTLIDPYAGRTDLKRKTVRAVGDANKRFNEDALRLMRAVRIATEFQFLIEVKTRQAIIVNTHLLTKIARERIRDEFFKILQSDSPADGVLFLKNTGLLEYLLPDLNTAFSIPQKSPKRHHIYDVGIHLVMALKACASKDVMVRLATLLHDIGKIKTFQKDPQTGLITFFNHEIVGAKMVKKMADDLRLSTKQKEKLHALVRYHQFTVSERQTDKAVRRFIREVGKENLEDMLILRTADRIGSGAKPTSWRFELFKKRLEEVQKEPFKITDLKINGRDVMGLLNLKPGPKVGQILKQVFDEVVEKKLLNERGQLLERIRTLQF